MIFQLLNRGKQSMGINLGNPQGQDIVRKLAAESDVLVSNLTPHRQERYGLQYEDISALNPRIIYIALTGYGIVDQTTSLAMTAAIGMALYERERSGKGQRIDCSLLHTGLCVMGADTVAALHERLMLMLTCLPPL